MGVFVWLTLGVAIGYLGSLIMRSEPDRGAVLSVPAGVLGALLASRLLAPLLGGRPDQGFFSVSVVLVSLLGAVVLVGLLNLLRHGRLR